MGVKVCVSNKTIKTLRPAEANFGAGPVPDPAMLVLDPAALVLDAMMLVLPPEDLNLSGF